MYLASDGPRQVTVAKEQGTKGILGPEPLPVGGPQL